jgi:uncharacterized membrane protein YkoI
MVMTDKVKNTALVVSSLAALALGGSAIAGAASNDNAASTANSAAATTQADDARPRQRSDETLLTGDAASKVSAAALAKVPGGTIERVETDADGNAKYEAHMTNADGSRVTVYVNADFDVVSVESGR